MKSLRVWCLLLAVWACWTPPLAGAESSSAAQVGEAQQQLNRIMQDPLFSRWKLRQERAARDSSQLDLEKELARYIDPIARYLNDLLDWLMRGRAGGGSSASGGTWFAIGPILKAMGWFVLGASALLVIWLIAMRLAQGRLAVPRRPLDRQTLDAALIGGDALATSSDVWVDHAALLAGEQNLRLALRAMYLALLSGLHAAGKIRYRRQQTNWQYVNNFRGSDDQRLLFAQLTGRFDEVWYGEREPDQASFDQVRGQIDHLLGDEQA